MIAKVHDDIGCYRQALALNWEGPSNSIINIAVGANSEIGFAIVAAHEGRKPWDSHAAPRQTPQEVRSQWEATGLRLPTKRGAA